MTYYERHRKDKSLKGERTMKSVKKMDPAVDSKKMPKKGKKKGKKFNPGAYAKAKKSHFGL